MTRYTGGWGGVELVHKVIFLKVAVNDVVTTHTHTQTDAVSVVIHHGTAVTEGDFHHNKLGSLHRWTYWLLVTGSRQQDSLHLIPRRPQISRQRVSRRLWDENQLWETNILVGGVCSKNRKQRNGWAAAAASLG